MLDDEDIDDKDFCNGVCIVFDLSAKAFILGPQNSKTVWVM